MKRILTIALLAFAFSMSAQTKTDIPAYRSSHDGGESEHIRHAEAGIRNKLLKT